MTTVGIPQPHRFRIAIQTPQGGSGATTITRLLNEVLPHVLPGTSVALDLVDIEEAVPAAIRLRHADMVLIVFRFNGDQVKEFARTGVQRQVKTLREVWQDIPIFLVGNFRGTEHLDLPALPSQRQRPGERDRLTRYRDDSMG